MRTAAFHTLGCKVNAYETEAMEQALTQAGYELRSFEEAADVYIVNTCSVTNIADRKSRQMLHRARSLNPDAVVVAAGCYAQAAAESLRQDGSVDLVLGNQEKKDIVNILNAYFSEELAAPVAVGDMRAARQYEDLAANQSAGHTRAFLKVQDGCNQYCSYCIIPFLRGNIRSRRPGDVRREAERLAAKGVKELVLTGIHLSSYGRDFKAMTEAEEGFAEGAANLLELLNLLDTVPGIERLRVGSLEPKIATPGFAAGLAEVRHFCPHFHLSLQSGSNATLRRMNRRYTAEEFRAGVAALRAVFPEAAITTDVIVGFPGESEEEFSESFAFIEEIRFYETHIFPYSKREGTRAAAMPEQVPGAVKKRRAALLQEINLGRQREFRTSRLGTAQEMLSEEVVAMEGREYLVGNSREYVKLAVPLAALQDGAAVNRLYRGTAERFLNSEILLLTNVSKT